MELHDLRAVLAQERIARRLNNPLTEAQLLEATRKLKNLVRQELDSADEILGCLHGCGAIHRAITSAVARAIMLMTRNRLAIILIPVGMPLVVIVMAMIMWPVNV